MKQITTPQLLMLAFILTMFLLIAYTLTGVLGKPDVTLQNCLFSAIGFWFGAGVSLMKKAGDTTP
jgi:uncharacterized RDD family membrane protein YckC